MAFFIDYDWEGPWNTLQFREDFLNYTGLTGNLKLGFILEVKGVKVAQGQVTLTDVGWTYLPIYEVLQNENGSNSVYCNSGLYTLPLFVGPVPKDIQQQLNLNPLNVLDTLRQNARFLEFASVIVRVHDN